MTKSDNNTTATPSGERAGPALQAVKTPATPAPKPKSKATAAGKPRVRVPATTTPPKPKRTSHSQWWTPPTPVDKQPLASANVDPDLIRILSWRRPHDSVSEVEFVQYLEKTCQRLVADLPGASVQKFGPGQPALDNLVVTIPQAGGLAPRVLFSSHTDTMHTKEDPPRQALAYDANADEIILDDPVTGDVLGADDGTGVWLMLNMISAAVPGSYVFHRGEEKGCIGSRWMRDNESAWLALHDVAVAFDRKGTEDVVYMQSGLTCASTHTTNALTAMLNEARPEGWVYGTFKPSAHGTVTDTKMYRDLIPEVFNLAVGYSMQHTSSEVQIWGYAKALSDIVCEIDWHSLKAMRDPTPLPPPQPSTWASPARPTTQATPATPAKPKDPLDELNGMTSLDDLVDWCHDDPVWAAETMMAMAFALARARADLALYRQFGDLGDLDV